MVAIIKNAWHVLLSVFSIMKYGVDIDKYVKS